MEKKEDFMRILITGGAGFIGSHAADAFAAAGHEVAVLDNLSTGKLENIAGNGFRFFHADLGDRAEVMEAFKLFRPEAVSHHAAQMSVKTSIEAPAFDAQINVIGQINLLEACVAFKTRKFIFASSGGTVYGDAALTPTPEDAPFQPLSPYGISKMAGEFYVAFFQQAHGLDATILRYGNVYGPRQEPHGEAGVVAIFAKRLLAGQGVQIDWDGEQRKDYLHVSDVAKANVLALDKGSGGIFNIASGRATSVNALFQALERRIKSGRTPEYRPKRPGDVRLSYLDIARARRELGWEPSIDLDEGLSDTLEFFRARLAQEGAHLG